MYLIPEDFDSMLLENSFITQISFSVNTISLFFEEIGYITIEGNFSFERKGQKMEYKDIFPIRSDFGLLNLLEKKLINLDIIDERSGLKLEFEDNMVVYLVGIDNYETFKINIKGKEIVI